MSEPSDSLARHLTYQPVKLKFGTSGRRGEVTQLTQLEIYINVSGELKYLQALAPEEGGIARGDAFYLGYDLRPSSVRFVAEQQEYGEILQAAEKAAEDAGMRPVNLGRIPTPGLAYYALSQGKGSIMVTGSHIPYDRNGYKLNTSRGELLKRHEGPVQDAVERVREEVMGTAFRESLFNERGIFKAGHRELAPECAQGMVAYLERYARFFEGPWLAGKNIVVYQHSAVGRDLLVELLRKFGANAIAMGRSEWFVPIDTENIDQELLCKMQAMADEAAALHGPIFAVVSTDGDSDRPLLLGVDRETRRVRFFGGDLVGMVVAEYLGADAVVVPISCNDAIDRGRLAKAVQPKTRIGSPYVIEGMEEARSKGYGRVCGWEANGGFLTGSDIERRGRVLTALATRDAMLPILCVLSAAVEQGLEVTDIFANLPRRFSRAALLKRFPRAVSMKILERFSGAGAVEALAGFFSEEQGFGAIARVDYTDGVRVIFGNGEVAHIRPSGNADELRIYAVADSPERADEIAALGVAEPEGILRRMERTVS